ncbi:hypothetical protein JT163_07860, partial [Helicobacter pylori]|nr:hypothetical protein [Helicobacter pylori]
MQTILKKITKCALAKDFLLEQSLNYPRLNKEGKTLTAVFNINLRNQATQLKTLFLILLEKKKKKKKKKQTHKT